jgi:hypothetical protein
MIRNEWQAEYQRGFHDGREQRGYDDGSVSTKGVLVDFRLTFRRCACAYSQGYFDGLAYRGDSCELVCAGE